MFPSMGWGGPTAGDPAIRARLASSRDVAPGAANLDGLCGHIWAAPKDLGRRATSGASAGVRAIVVVVLEVRRQVGAQGREAGDQGEH